MELRYNCPFCEQRRGTPDHKAHLHYNVEKELWFCFRCQAKGHGDLPLEGTPVSEGKVPTRIEPINWNKAHPLDYILECASVTAATAASYLRSHHINPKWAAWNERLFVEGSWLIFPHFGGSDPSQVTYWQKRHLWSKLFLNCPEEKPVHFVDYRKSKNKKAPICIMESVTNALRMSRYLPCAVIYGKHITEAQAQTLVALKHPLFVFLDFAEFADSVMVTMRLLEAGADAQISYLDAHRVSKSPKMWMPGADVCDLPESDVEKLAGSIRSQFK